MRRTRTSHAKKSDQLIARKMNLGEMVAVYPELVEVLTNDYGLHCAGCFASSFDTLEEGAKVHGFNDKDIDKMVKRLNEIVKQKRRGE